MDAAKHETQKSSCLAALPAIPRSCSCPCHAGIQLGCAAPKYPAGPAADSAAIHDRGSIRRQFAMRSPGRRSHPQGRPRGGLPTSPPLPAKSNRCAPSSTTGQTAAEDWRSRPPKKKQCRRSLRIPEHEERATHGVIRRPVSGHPGLEAGDRLGAAAAGPRLQLKPLRMPKHGQYYTHGTGPGGRACMQNDRIPRGDDCTWRARSTGGISFAPATWPFNPTWKHRW